MITKETIEQIVRGYLEGKDIFIVEVEVSGGNRIEVSVDKPAGVSLDECIGINRHINSVLDREVEDYELEVSSPGLGSAFKVEGQYLKNLDKDVEIVFTDGSKLSGILKAYSTQGIELEYIKIQKAAGSSKKEKIVVREFFGFEKIKTTKTEIKFK